VLKNSLAVLLIVFFVCLSAITSLRAVQIFYEVARLQVENDLRLTRYEP